MNLHSIMLAFMLITASVLSGCTSTTLNTSSKDDQYSGTVSKVYILGVSHRLETRQQFEETVAKTLTNHGVIGVPSYQDLPALDEISDEKIEEKVKAAGADTLLLTLATGRGSISAADIIQPEAFQYALIAHGGQGDRTYPQPYYKRYGTNDHVPRSYKPDGFYMDTAFSDYASFSNPTRQVILTPLNEHETIVIGTYLFDTQTKRLIWSAELEAKRSNSTDTLITDFIKTVANDLKKQGLI